VTLHISEIQLRSLANEPLSHPEVLFLAEAAQKQPYELMYRAHQVRRQNFSNKVRLCSIAAGKLGACREDCKWCAQSVHWSKSDEPVRRASVEQVAAAARSATGHCVASFGIVNSGRRPSQAELESVIESAHRIRSDNPDSLTLCASLGELTAEQATALADAGIHRYNHNLETTERIFRQVVTTHSYADRLATIRSARQAGLKLCCGGLMGLGETWEDRVDLALTLRDQVDPEIVPLNFLHPIPGTPLGDRQPLDPLEILSIVALFRLVLPRVDIKIAGGREKNLRDLQSWAFYAGATSCIVGNYLTTQGRDVQADLQMFRDLGLEVVESF